MADSGLEVLDRAHVLTFDGLDDLIHADTMLFILGLTLFVSVIAQTRVLEGITFVLLRRYQGAILPTVVSVTAVVAVVSGVLGGVSMIGLIIRTLVIILMLASAPVAAIRYAVMVCTAITTICGVWTAYGEPPNLIMKANLYPNLDNLFFLFYGVPVAVAQLSRGRLADAWKAARAARRSRDHGCPRRERRRRPLSSGDPSRRGDDAGRTRRRARDRTFEGTSILSSSGFVTASRSASPWFTKTCRLEPDGCCWAISSARN